MESVMPPGEVTTKTTAPPTKMYCFAILCQNITIYTVYHSDNQLFCQDWTNIAKYWHCNILHIRVCHDWTNVESYWHTCMPVLPVYAKLMPVLTHKINVYWSVSQSVSQSFSQSVRAMFCHFQAENQRERNVVM